MGLRLLRAVEAGLLIAALAACKDDDGKPNQPASRPSGSRAEVQAVFSELQVREEQHLLEHGRYLAARDGDDGWRALGVEPVVPAMTCTYQVAVVDAYYTITAQCPDGGYVLSSKTRTLEKVD
jgi:hypothetical protein